MTSLSSDRGKVVECGLSSQTLYNLCFQRLSILPCLQYLFGYLLNSPPIQAQILSKKPADLLCFEEKVNSGNYVLHNAPEVMGETSNF